MPRWHSAPIADMSTAAVSEIENEQPAQDAGSEETEAKEAQRQSIKRLAVSGATVVAVGFGIGQVIKLLSSIILTRLIHPEVYGLMDLATSCMVGIHLFSDLGINPCVVQSKRGEEPIFLRTAWTIQVLRSVVIAIVSILIAWPISHFYHRPILLFLLPVIGSISIVEALTSIGSFVLTRKVLRGRLMLLELLASVFTLILTILLIYFMRPEGVMEVWHRVRPSLGLDENLVWAVVLGMLGARFIVMLLSHGILPGPTPRFVLDRSSAKEMMGFAKWVFFSTILTFIGTQIDRFLVPKLAGFEAAGLYGRALGLLGISTGIISSFNVTVIYPIFGRLQNEGQDITDYYPKIHRILSILGAIVMSGLIATGPSVTRVLYPAEYSSVGWLLQIFAIGAWFQMLQDFLGSGMLASGRRRAFVLPNAVRAISMFLLLVPCWWLGRYFGYGDLVGIVLGWVAINLATYLSATLLARASGLRVWPGDLFMTVLLGAISVTGLKAGGVLSSLLGAAAPETRWGWLAHFLIMGTTTTLVWGVFLLIAWRRGTFDMLKRSGS